MRKKKQAKEFVGEISCKNCETKFIGNFCPNCGQSIKEFERPFGFLFIDLMGNVFAFDTRFWKTFKAILFKPGKMSLEFVKGRRVRYMPPFRFYVFVSFIFFFLLNVSTNRNIRDSDFTLVGNNSNSDTLAVAPVVINTNQDSSDTVTNKLNTAVESDQSLNYSIDVDEDENTEILDVENINKNPGIYIGRIFKYLSWSVFILMPFYGFLLWIFYHRSQKYYVTHLILAINQHSFMFVAFLIVTLLSYVLPDLENVYAFLIVFGIPVYFFIGQKRLYKQRWWAILLKMTGMGIIYWSLLLTILVLVILFAFEVDFAMLWDEM